MPSIILRSGELYVDSLRAILDQPLDMETTQRLFPGIDESDGVMIKRLIYSLLDLVPKLGSVISDKDNLPDERSLAALVFTYLIMPFDILPVEQYGLLGYLDDTLVAHTLSANITESDEAIVALSAANLSDVADLMAKLPDWFTEAVTRFGSQASTQIAPLQR